MYGAKQEMKRLDVCASPKRNWLEGVDTLIPLHLRILDENDFNARDITIHYIDNIKNYSEKLKLLIVGSLAYDSISTEVNKVENTLGGSAVYAGISLPGHLEEYSTIQKKK